MRLTARLLLTLCNELCIQTRPLASRGLSRPRASRAWITQHLPTGFACRCAALRVDKQGYPPHGLPPWFENPFSYPFWSASQGGAAGRARAGGLQAPQGSGGAAPCRGSRRRRGTRWGLQCAPLWGADYSLLTRCLLFAYLPGCCVFVAYFLHTSPRSLQKVGNTEGGDAKRAECRKGFRRFFCYVTCFFAWLISGGSRKQKRTLPRPFLGPTGCYSRLLDAYQAKAAKVAVTAIRALRRWASIDSMGSNVVGKAYDKNGRDDECGNHF